MWSRGAADSVSHLVADCDHSEAFLALETMTIFGFCLHAVVVLSVVDAHMRFEYPPARSSSTGIKEPYPCGEEGFFDPAHPVTTLQPGPNVFKFHESIAHTGAPMRVAISMGDDSGFDEHVLLAHVPHNDAISGVFGLTSYEFSFVVDVPDVQCDRCALQVLSIMTDKIKAGACCSYPSDSAYKCFSVYHSCANVRINGTGTALPPGLPKAQSQFFTKGEGSETAYVEMGDDWQLLNPYPKFNPASCQCDATRCVFNPDAAAPAAETPLPRNNLTTPGTAAQPRTLSAALACAAGLAYLLS
jgi:hypothetical protein